ncbi:hypothetical protein ACQY0O_005726 [Thecaphora frezii]
MGDFDGSSTPLSAATPAAALDFADYQMALSSLREAERAERYDYAALRTLSAEGRRANDIVARLRADEIAAVWRTNLPDVAPPTATTDGFHRPAQPDLSKFPGMDFHGARSAGLLRVSEGGASGDANDAMKVWRIVQRMPKGALLHCHFDGSVDIRFLLTRACETPNMCMRASRPLVGGKALYDADVTFCVLPDDEVRAAKGTGATIWTPSYQPEAWVPFDEARRSFPFGHPYLDAETGEVFRFLFPEPAQATASDEARSSLRFDAYIHSLTTMTPHLHRRAAQNSEEAWSRFLKTFAVIGGLIGYEPTWKAYVKQMLKAHARDGVAYTEVRMNFFDPYIVSAATKRRDLEHAAWVRLFQEAVEEMRDEMRRDEPDLVFWGARIIYVTVRVVDKERLRWYCDDCIALKKQFPEWIVGFDLVGHEDPGLPLRYYAEELVRFQHQVREQRVGEVPFVFHAGETLGDGEAADENLYDALALGTRRLGHAISLPRHPHLISLCKQRRVTVEACPISNQVLGYTANIAAHPSLLTLLNQNVPLALCSDDPAIFENYGLSYDFYQVLISSHSTTLASLGVLVHQSIDAALVDDATKQQWHQTFRQQWDGFLRWILAEFADQAPSPAP